MRVISGTVSVAANSKSTNQLSGKQGEYAEGNLFARLLLSAAAASQYATCMAGNRNIVDDQEFSNSNRFPIEPDDVYAEFGVVAGERLSLVIRNDTAGPVVTKYKIVLVDA